MWKVIWPNIHLRHRGGEVGHPHTQRLPWERESRALLSGSISTWWHPGPHDNDRAGCVHTPREKEEDLALLVESENSLLSPFENVGGGDPVCLAAARSHPLRAGRPGCSRESLGPGRRPLRAQIPRGGGGSRGRGCWRPSATLRSSSHSREGRELRGPFRAQQVPADASRDSGIQDLLQKSSSRMNIWKDQLG